MVARFRPIHTSKRHHFSVTRFIVASLILILIVMVVLGRLVYLDSADKRFLRTQGSNESTRIKTTAVLRGMIYDRHAMPLAISAPIDNVIFNPKQLLKAPNVWQRIADNALLGLSPDAVQAMLLKKPNSQFMYVKKGMSPQLASTVTNMHIDGVYVEPVQNSFFPQGAAAAQLVGFTDLSNAGQSGLELSYNKTLLSQNAKTQYEVDAHGAPLAVKKIIQVAKTPHNLTLSVDSRLQFIAYEALKKEVIESKATSGSVVVLNPYNGEVLASVSYPSFNPNIRSDRHGMTVKDRSITDIFEPGSVMKAFTLAAALQDGKYNVHSEIETSPGYYYIHGHKIQDDGNFGLLDFSGIMIMSSNVGASKVALSQPRSITYDMYTDAGFGRFPGGHFPGEASGTMHPLGTMSKFEFATITFGYHLNASLLQLARAYGAIANGGVLYPVSFVKQKQPTPGQRIMSNETARDMRQLLKSVVSDLKGTSLLSNVPGYTVGGKTGTTQKVGKHGYDKHLTNAVFVGIAPADHPLFVVAVRINAPMAGHYYRYGGVSAAPVFASIAGQGMRLYGVMPNKRSIDEKLFHHQERFYKSIVGA